MSELAGHLKRIVGDEHVLTDEQALDDYGRDAVGWARLRPEAGQPRAPACVVQPATTEEVVQIVRLAQETETPLVPYGSGTGVMGAATSLHRGVVLELSRMNAILRISPEDRTATVQPGVILGDLDRELERAGLMLGHDPWSQPIASVGGAISTNGLGYLAARYGSMGDQVLGLEAVTPTGQLIRTKPLPQATIGPDLTHLFIGAEGVFGVLTEATLRVHPLPEERRLYAVRFPSFAAGFRAVCDIFAIGLVPAMVDMGEEGMPHIASSGDFPTTLYMALDGFREEVEAQEKRAMAMIGDQGGQILDAEEVHSYWRTRHRSAERYLEARAQGQRHPWSRNRRPGAFDYLHTALPISRVLEYRERAIRVFEEQGMEVHECAIWGPPELFSLLVVDPTAESEADFKRAGAASDAALRLAQDLGGNMEHVHGVGLRLVHLLERELGPDGMAVARRLRSALDPAGIMNPGKLYR